MTVRVRFPVRKRLLDIAEWVYRDEKVLVSPTWDWTDPRQSTLFLGTGQGDTTPDTIGHGDQISDDEWTVAGSLWVIGFRDGLSAEAETDRLLGLYETSLRADPTLYDQLAWEPAEGSQYPTWNGLRSAAISQVTGPWHTAKTPHDPVAGRCTFEITCTSTLHP